jgi:hypothetical protein
LPRDEWYSPSIPPDAVRLGVLYQQQHLKYKGQVYRVKELSDKHVIIIPENSALTDDAREKEKQNFEFKTRSDARRAEWGAPKSLSEEQKEELKELRKRVEKEVKLLPAEKMEILLGAQKLWELFKGKE